MCPPSFTRFFMQYIKKFVISNYKKNAGLTGVLHIYAEIQDAACRFIPPFIPYIARSVPKS